jgi:hypothetical protein
MGEGPGVRVNGPKKGGCLSDPHQNKIKIVQHVMICDANDHETLGLNLFGSPRPRSFRTESILVFKLLLCRMILSEKSATCRDHALAHFQVKWIRFTVENAAHFKKRADSTSVETALASSSENQSCCLPSISMMSFRSKQRKATM